MNEYRLTLKLEKQGVIVTVYGAELVQITLQKFLLDGKLIEFSSPVSRIHSTPLECYDDPMTIEYE